MEFVDKILKCIDCSNDFIFAAGEQLFFYDKQFKNDPKRCKHCKAKRAAGPGSPVRTETRTTCSECGTETTVPFKPSQGRPVLCRGCFQGKRLPAAGGLGLDRPSGLGLDRPSGLGLDRQSLGLQSGLGPDRPSLQAMASPATAVLDPASLEPPTPSAAPS